MVIYLSSRLRSMHEAILIGVDTAINDDPQLNGKFKKNSLGH
jgi:riboflavin biosynthesis pyrimidine reductase